MYKIEIEPKTLHFKQSAGTSRGVYTTRQVWYLHLTSEEQPGREGIGECAPLPKLSCDDLPDYEEILFRACREHCALIRLFCLAWKQHFAISSVGISAFGIPPSLAENKAFPLTG